MRAALFLIGVTLLALLGAVGCDTVPFVPDALLGTWFRKDDAARYQLTLEADAFTLVSEPSIYGAAGLYTLAGNTARITDAQCTTGTDEIPGTYRLEVDSTTLKIGALDDACTSRRLALSGTWSTGDMESP